MFIGRERELKSLNEVYSKAGFGMTIIYGRRRVGKSYLITEFIKDKKAKFYTATKVGAERNLELFQNGSWTFLILNIVMQPFHQLRAYLIF